MADNYFLKLHDRLFFQSNSENQEGLKHFIGFLNELARAPLNELVEVVKKWLAEGARERERVREEKRQQSGIWKEWSRSQGYKISEDLLELNFADYYEGADQLLTLSSEQLIEQLKGYYAYWQGRLNRSQFQELREVAFFPYQKKIFMNLQWPSRSSPLSPHYKETVDSLTPTQAIWKDNGDVLVIRGEAVEERVVPGGFYACIDNSPLMIKSSNWSSLQALQKKYMRDQFEKVGHVLKGEVASYLQIEHYLGRKGVGKLLGKVSYINQELTSLIDDYQRRIGKQVDLYSLLEAKRHNIPGFIFQYFLDLAKFIDQGKNFSELDNFLRRGEDDLIKNSFYFYSLMHSFIPELFDTNDSIILILLFRMLGQELERRLRQNGSLGKLAENEEVVFLLLMTSKLVTSQISTCRVFFPVVHDFYSRRLVELFLELSEDFVLSDYLKSTWGRLTFAFARVATSFHKDFKHHQANISSLMKLRICTYDTTLLKQTKLMNKEGHYVSWRDAIADIRELAMSPYHHRGDELLYNYFVELDKLAATYPLIYKLFAKQIIKPSDSHLYGFSSVLEYYYFGNFNVRRGKMIQLEDYLSAVNVEVFTAEPVSFYETIVTDLLRFEEKINCCLLRKGREPILNVYSYFAAGASYQEMQQIETDFISDLESFQTWARAYLTAKDKNRAKRALVGELQQAALDANMYKNRMAGFYHLLRAASYGIEKNIVICLNRNISLGEVGERLQLLHDRLNYRLGRVTIQNAPAVIYQLCQYEQGLRSINPAIRLLPIIPESSPSMDSNVRMTP